MATLKSEFAGPGGLADELINDEFADFKVSFNVSKSGEYDPRTDTEIGGQSFTSFAIPDTTDNAEQIFSNVTSDDIFVIVYRDENVPSDLDASWNVLYDSKQMTISDVETDPAKAVFFVRMRK